MSTRSNVARTQRHANNLMKDDSHYQLIFLMRHLIFMSIFLIAPSQAYAYIGPGMGLGVAGVVLGIFFGLVLMVVSVFWYPLKRLYRKIFKKPHQK